MTNKQFNRLTDLSKRVFIAKDALLQLKLGKILPVQGVYFGNTTLQHSSDDYVGDGKSFKDYLLETAEPCQVCAKGAMVCSLVRNFNRYDVGDIQYISDITEMTVIFGRVIWGIIEALYEGWYFDADGSTTNGYLFFKPEEYDYNHNKVKWSMESILKNIIKNKGKLNYNGVIFE